MSSASFIAPDSTVVASGPHVPTLGDSVVVMPGARITGDVTIGDYVGIWFNVVIRGDVHWVRIGEQTNVQDNAVLHVTHDTNPLLIGRRVTIGHAARLHGCTLDDECLIGIGAIVLDGAQVESHAIVAAGAVVPPGATVTSGTVVAGVPARVVRDVRPAERDNFVDSAMRYVRYAADQATTIGAIRA